jgi:integron integrase
MASASVRTRLDSQGASVLDQLRTQIRLRHYSIRTEQAYVDWVWRFMRFHHGQHPRQLDAKHVEAFLTDLALRRRVSASTQNQARSAILFLFRAVIGRELPWLEGVVAGRAPQKLPVVLSREEVQAVLSRMRGPPGVAARLLYGSGLRIMECMRLRVKDVDLAGRQITVRGGKGAKDRVTMLPASLVQPVRRQLDRVQALHEEDLALGGGAVHLPESFDDGRRSLTKDWAWQYLFPSTRSFTDARTGEGWRDHADEKPVQRSLQAALRAARIHKPATPHSLRHYLPFLTMSGNEDRVAMAARSR